MGESVREATEQKSGPVAVVLTSSLAIAGVSVVFWWLNYGTAADFAFGNRFTPLVLTATGVVFVVVGWMIATRRPRHAIGRICLAIGLAMSLNVLCTEYAAYALRTNLGSLPGGEFAAWTGNWTWVGGIGLIGSVLVLHFPDGRLPGSRWRPILTLAVVGMAAAMVYFAVAPGPLESIQWVDNPFGLEGAPAWIDILSLGFVVLALTFVAAAWSIRLRYRRALGETRAQIKWFTAAAVLVAATYVGQFVFSLATGTLEGGSEVQRWFQTLTVAMFGALGVSIGIAILRYHLYDIDRIVSRTVSYSLVVGLLVAVVAAVAALAGAQFEEPWVVAATTLAVAALFNPLRTRVQRLVDRRFNRSKYDAERVVAEFAGSLRDHVDPDGVVDGWLGVVDSTMQPASVGVWVREAPAP